MNPLLENLLDKTFGRKHHVGIAKQDGRITLTPDLVEILKGEDRVNSELHYRVHGRENPPYIEIAGYAEKQPEHSRYKPIEIDNHNQIRLPREILNPMGMGLPNGITFVVYRNKILIYNSERYNEYSSNRSGNTETYWNLAVRIMEYLFHRKNNSRSQR